jgi:hypothetical protein
MNLTSVPDVASATGNAMPHGCGVSDRLRFEKKTLDFDLVQQTSRENRNAGFESLAANAESFHRNVT